MGGHAKPRTAPRTPTFTWSSPLPHGSALSLTKEARPILPAAPPASATIDLDRRLPHASRRQAGPIALLHTWDQQLDYHPPPPLHHYRGCPQSGGKRWISIEAGFFLPIKKLSQGLPRGVHPGVRGRRSRGQRAARGPSRYVVSPPRLGSSTASPRSPAPEQVLRYLGRYTTASPSPTSASSPHRDRQVSFSLQGRKGRRPAGKSMTLGGAGVRPPFPASRRPQRLRPRASLWLARQRHQGRSPRQSAWPARPAGVPRADSPHSRGNTWQDAYRRLVGRDPLWCPACGVGRLVTVEPLPPRKTTSRRTKPASRSP